MTGITITEVGDGATRFEAKLRGLGDRIGDMPLMGAAVMEGLEKYHEATWGSGVEDTPATDERWPQHGPLLNTGALRDSMTKTFAHGAVRVITPYGFAYGTSIFYGHLLQRGTRKMAAKPVMRARRELELIVWKLVHDWIAR